MTQKEIIEQEKKLNNLLELVKELETKKQLSNEDFNYINNTSFLYSCSRLNALQVVARLTLVLTHYQVNFDDITKALEDVKK